MMASDMKAYPKISVSGKVRYLTQEEEAEFDRKVAAGKMVVLSSHPSEEDIKAMRKFYEDDDFGLSCNDLGPGG